MQIFFFVHPSFYHEHFFLLLFPYEKIFVLIIIFFKSSNIWRVRRQDIGINTKHTCCIALTENSFPNKLVLKFFFILFVFTILTAFDKFFRFCALTLNSLKPGNTHKILNVSHKNLRQEKEGMTNFLLFLTEL